MKKFCAIFLSYLSFSISPAEDAARDSFESLFGNVPSVSKKEAELLRSAANSGSDEEALKILEASRSEDWFGAGASFNLGNAYYRMGAYSDAARAYNAAIKKMPAFFMARKNLGFALSALGDREGARGEFLKALALSGGSDSDILLWLASMHLEKGDFSSALTCCNQALVYSPGLERAKFYKALSLCELKLNDEAEKLCLELLSDRANNAEVMKLLARVRAAKGDRRGAIAALKILSAAGKCDAGTSEFLGALYYSEGLYGLSAATLGKRRAVDCAYAAFRSGDIESALKIAQSARGEPGASKVIALCHLFSGDFNSAFETFSSIPKNLSPDPELDFYAARAAAALGKISEAISLYSSAAQSAGFEKAAMYGILAVYSRNGDIFNALQTARKIESSFPSDEIGKYRKRLEDRLNDMEKPAR